MEVEMLGFGILNTAQGIRNSTNDCRIQNPSFIDKDWNPVPGIRNPLHEILNPRLFWIPFHRAKIPEI